MKKILSFISAMIMLTAVSSAQEPDEKETAKAMFMNALDKRTDIAAGAGTSYIHIKGDGLTNSSGVKALNYNYFIGTSSMDVVNKTKAYTLLEFTAGKMHANMPGHSSDSLTIFNASSFDAWYLTAGVGFGYQLISKKAFYVGVETGANFDLLAQMHLEGNAGDKEGYLSTYNEDFRSFNWGWFVGSTAAFRSLFINFSVGTSIKDYSLVSGKSVKIPFRTRIMVGLRLSSKYGDKDAAIIDKLTGL